ncbi:hypothetical protein PPL_03636 [Heterostelium album PN500]|uniref:Uncharacterized protein n=1 Tax=Heterostelium pallidum (strain ATCC 26659 / Pp 5 / PN500) TaxID=670386 RepID=D3B5C1_HETP5|nr:hypothetical protein PPL_03636 [Heterostelium album PN500]EFA83486.1 hypothetical protein PPL_03636 [Heterostelium album PN500]|eukprot:XP_020435603.1 hypothetical protein PPL_03636 [Heterostelium album PN500]
MALTSFSGSVRKSCSASVISRSRSTSQVNTCEVLSLVNNDSLLISVDIPLILDFSGLDGNECDNFGFECDDDGDDECAIDNDDDDDDDDDDEDPLLLLLL